VTWEAVASWKRKGRKGVEPYATFLHLTTLATSRVEEALVDCWFNAGKTDWKAAQAYLERRKWNEWGSHAPKQNKPKDPGAMSNPELVGALIGELVKYAAQDPNVKATLLEKLQEQAPNERSDSGDE
jgi:hypothetical protein